MAGVAGVAWFGILSLPSFDLLSLITPFLLSMGLGWVWSIIVIMSRHVTKYLLGSVPNGREEWAKAKMAFLCVVMIRRWWLVGGVGWFIVPELGRVSVCVRFPWSLCLSNRSRLGFLFTSWTRGPAGCPPPPPPGRNSTGLGFVPHTAEYAMALVSFFFSVSVSLSVSVTVCLSLVSFLHCLSDDDSPLVSNLFLHAFITYRGMGWEGSKCCWWQWWINGRFRHPFSY
jgi:hypothetical protein